MNKLYKYIIVYLSSTLAPAIPFLILLINKESINQLILILLSFPIIISFIFLSYLFRDSITRDPNPMGIFYYISKLSKYLLPTFGFFLLFINNIIYFL